MNSSWENQKSRSEEWAAAAAKQNEQNANVSHRTCR